MTAVNPAIARHFTSDELRDASTFLSEHRAELPQFDDGPRIFPDAYRQRVHRELKRITEEHKRGLRPDEGPESDSPLELQSETELSDADYQLLVQSAADSFNRSRSIAEEIAGRIEAAWIASRRKPRRERSPDRFMATTDEYVEPYFAIRNGMSLGEVARKFNIPDMQAYMAAVEQWLSMLEVAFPRFNRNMFLARLERAVEKRRNDAVRVGTVTLPRELRVRNSGPDIITVSNECRTNAGVMGQNLPGCSLRTPETERALAVARSLPPTPQERRSRELERGLIQLLEVIPFSDRSRELVRIVELAKEGKTRTAIARELGINPRTVARRLELIAKAAEITPLCGVQVATTEDHSSERVSGVESADYGKKWHGAEVGAVL